MELGTDCKNIEMQDVVIHKGTESSVLFYLHNLHQYEQMSKKKLMILVYIFCIILYIGVQIGMLILNTKPQDYIGKK